MNPKINDYFFEPIAYFTSRLMYYLEIYGSKNNRYITNGTTIYRGLILDYECLSSYERSKGKIILIPAFSSCSLSIEIAKAFSEGEWYDIFEKKPFSVIFYIKFNHKVNWISNGINTQNISDFPKEEEIIIQAFSFFYVRDIKIDMNKHTAVIYLETIGREEILENNKNGKDIIYNEKENIMQIEK